MRINQAGWIFRWISMTSTGKRSGSRAVFVAVAAAFLLIWGAARPVVAAHSAPEGDKAADPAKEASSSKDYVIGVEDVLQISVWKNPDLSVTIPVRPDGKISLPLIDDVPAAGLTPDELKKILSDRWSAFLSEPEVSVLVKEVNSFKVYVIGEVARPGELRLKSKLRLLQAIALAGGFTTYADRGKLLVLRDSNGMELRYEINYNKVVSGDKPEDNLVLMPGDTIVVP